MPSQCLVRPIHGRRMAPLIYVNELFAYMRVRPAWPPAIEGTLLADPNQSKRSPGDRSETRDHVEVDPHIAEPVIGRAFARPVGSSGLQLRSLCALVGTLRCPPCQLRCANCFASRASAVSIGELRQINPTGKSLKVCPALRAKIFRLTRRANQ